MVELVTIDRLGHRGDGVADTASGPLFIPRALPGERVEVERDGDRGRLLAVLEPSPQRVAPYCPEVGICGGCALQEFEQTAALGWKRELLLDAFRRERLDVAAVTDPCRDAHGEGRRRATFHARADADGRVRVGFAQARSHAIAAIDACPLLAPGLRGALPAARALAATLARAAKPLDIVVTASEGGLDVDVRGLGAPSEALRLKLVQLADRLDLARLAIHGDVVVERRKPLIAMGRAWVTPAPGGFLQATALGEETIVSLARAALAKRRKVADLFCGVGAFAFRFAETAEVYAAEADRKAIAALDAAARKAPGLKRIRAEARDLFRRPLTAAELNGFDAVAFDPPRAGAEAQARMIAESKVPLVVAVSCDAGTLARDAAILIRGGYRLTKLTPVDQFRHAAHVEAVGVFQRP
ncbi:putative RNA methyltransferase [Methylopila jiangsuensis]|uniref:RNA methyltransferase n=1 Tax=Methylopila jiangsuensis TaxID=586230 RepID=A0A9W6JMI4_9HYPH|nr:TRAM domain-containing protein [Methylopila jiangsuensis]MDR6284412.1 23S rRNA (uracil1939-C5)-methyltransferase [Methylopila jiangsuensis]GLK78203.1 putative RNA methyltransferase [Methylopila jiangsuensis]